MGAMREFAAVMLLIGFFGAFALPAFGLLVEAFRPPPRAVAASPSRWRWVWYVFQAAVFAGSVLVLIAANPHPKGNDVGLEVLFAGGFSFYATFAVSFYGRLFQWVRNKIGRRWVGVGMIDGDFERPALEASLRGGDVREKRLGEPQRRAAAASGQSVVENLPRHVGPRLK